MTRPWNFDPAIHACSCHARMGNDFYFLPAADCIRDEGVCDAGSTIAHEIEAAAMVLGERDPIRGGRLT